MDDPSLTLNERAVLDVFARDPKRPHRERDLKAARPVINSLIRRGLVRGLGGDSFLLTDAGRRVVTGKKP